MHETIWCVGVFHRSLLHITQNFHGCRLHTTQASVLHMTYATLPHPYSPLRANAFLRISRNRVQASNPHLNKRFGMNICHTKAAKNAAADFGISSSG